MPDNKKKIWISMIYFPVNYCLYIILHPCFTYTLKYTYIYHYAFITFMYRIQMFC